MAQVRAQDFTEEQIRMARWRVFGFTALAWAILGVMWLAGS